MPEPIITPYIPQTITVHLGPPNSDAENVTVSFSDYVKNVASSEIYPTWEPAAIRANVLAIISFALNRVYTEYYPSRGYPFQITSSTAYDQKFIKGRSIFENVGQIVDDVFRDYIRYPGHVEPLAAKFCNGTTSTCDGLSQWGSQALAEQGYNSVDILRHYYGDDIQIVTGAPVKGVQSSYHAPAPGRPGAGGDSNSDHAQPYFPGLPGNPENPRGRRHIRGQYPGGGEAFSGDFQSGPGRRGGQRHLV